MHLPKKDIFKVILLDKINTFRQKAEFIGAEKQGDLEEQVIDTEGLQGIEKFEVTKVKERPIVRTKVTVSSKNLESGLSDIYEEVIKVKKYTKVIAYSLTGLLALCLLVSLVAAGIALKG